MISLAARAFGERATRARDPPRARTQVARPRRACSSGPEPVRPSRRLTSVDPTRDRAAAGAALRAATPRSAHAAWVASSDRADPIGLLEASNVGRVAELVPIRFGRMAASPFAFFRGSAGLMAMDLATTPATGLRVQACGDAHVSNFGEFATPEHTLVFDINDFDETLPGPWEWDVKRLAVSLDLVVRLPRPRRRSAPSRRRGDTRVPRAHGGLPPSSRPRPVARPDRLRRRRPPLPGALPVPAPPERRARTATDAHCRRRATDRVRGRPAPVRRGAAGDRPARQHDPPPRGGARPVRRLPGVAVGRSAPAPRPVPLDGRRPEDRRDRERRHALLGGPVRGAGARGPATRSSSRSRKPARRSSSPTSAPRRCRTTACGW